MTTLDRVFSAWHGNNLVGGTNGTGREKALVHSHNAVSKVGGGEVETAEHAANRGGVGVCTSEGKVVIWPYKDLLAARDDDIHGEGGGVGQVANGGDISICERALELDLSRSRHDF